MWGTFHTRKGSSTTDCDGWDVGTSDCRTEKKVAVMRMDKAIK